ncbi:MAG TPA: 3-hydroxyacyl-ACP dehydratase [Chitinophagaceae bacterium]
MLKDTFYKIILFEHQENIINANLEINKDSEIFKGHFPGQPVLPGACMLQIVKEVLESTLNIPFRLKKANHIKFLRIIDPGSNNILQLMLSYKSTDNNNIDVTANLIAQKDICFKFRGSFIAL